MDQSEFQEIVEELSSYRGRHTELVTVLVPAGFNMNTISKQLEAEKSTADNIKSASTRKNVVEALEKIIRELKGSTKTPENGVALFCGNVSQNEGQTDIKLWAIEPIKPLKIRLYRCDQVFVTEPLKEMLEVDEIYGLLVIERKEATIGLLEGKNIKMVKHMTSGVPGKYKTGGQCLAPTTAIDSKNGTKKLSEVQVGDEVRALDFNSNKIIFTKVLNKWKKTIGNCYEIFVKDCRVIKSSTNHTFFKEDKGKIIKIIAKKLSAGDSLIAHDNKDLIELPIEKISKVNKDIELIDIETEIGNFFANGILVHNSAQRFERLREGIAKEFFRRVADDVKDAFFNIPKLKGILVGGPGPTKEDFLAEGQLVTALKNKVIAVKDIGYSDEHGLKLLVESAQEELKEQGIIKEKQILEKFFNTLGKNPEKIAYGLENVKTALKAGAVEKILISEKLKKDSGTKEEIKKIERAATETSADVILISNETNEGLQFENLSGFGAFLRYAFK
ncbi:hypothetical protein COV15_00930 [Candidatus Woesearchaeota archaeon CG10_big_fil_rev_8_21_14_0_10_34_12]|nr:MAG: hypothetical protein COV15_00930 [Candidatus Woesearchaeota archaeon CG10_big_fil_rev_8_21_14_0_10_34_12]